MNTFTQKVNTMVIHPKFERRLFRTLIIALGVLVVIYGTFLANTVVAVIEQRVAQSDTQKIASNIGGLESQYLALGATINLTTATTYGFTESKKVAYAVRGGDVKAFAFRQ